MIQSHPLIFKNIFRPDGNYEQFDWQPFRDGVEIYRIYGDSSGPAAALLRYQPGASVPHHDHTGYEHIFILSGSQSDARDTYGTGTLAINPPHTSHQVFSESGCVVLIIWEKPIVIKE